MMQHIISKFMKPFPLHRALLIGLAVSWMGHIVPAKAAPSQHYLCTMTHFTRTTADGVHNRPLSDFYLIRENSKVTVGIVGQFEVFSDWVFTITWQKGAKIIAAHPDGSFSFDGTVVQMVTPQLVSGISAIRAQCSLDTD